MNKKFLSAILFGALMVTSTGTFVSCKDYDDDIENLQGQISANSSAIAELKALIGDGNYVTGISVNGQNLVVNTKNGSATVALPECEDNVGSICTISEEGELLIDGKATGIKVAEQVEGAEFKPAVEIVDGEWAVLQEDGSYLSTGVAVSSVAVTGNEQDGYVLTVKDAEGNATVVELPTAASAITSIRLTEEVTPFEFILTKATFSKPSSWAGPKTLPADKSVIYSANSIDVRIDPVTVPAGDVTFTLANSLNAVLSHVELNASATQDSDDAALTTGNAHGRAAVTGNGLWTLKMDQLILTEAQAAAFSNGTDKELDNYAAASTAFAVNVNNKVRSEYGIKLKKATANHLTAVQANGKTATSYTLDATTGSSHVFEADINKVYTIEEVAGEEGLMFDMYFSLSEAAKKTYGVVYDNAARTFQVTKNPDASTDAKAFDLFVYTIDTYGQVRKACYNVSLSSSIDASTSYEAVEFNIANLYDDDPYNNYITLDMDIMKNALGEAKWIQWANSVDEEFSSTTVVAHKKADLSDAGVSVADELTYDFYDADWAGATVSTLKYMDFTVNTTATNLKLDTQYYLNITFNTASGTKINNIVVPVKFTAPSVADQFTPKAGYVVDGKIMAYYYDIAKTYVELSRYFAAYDNNATLSLDGNTTAVASSSTGKAVYSSELATLGTTLSTSTLQLKDGTINVAAGGTISQNSTTNKEAGYGLPLLIEVQNLYYKNSTWAYADGADDAKANHSFEMVVMSPIAEGKVVPAAGNTIEISANSTEGFDITKSMITGYDYNNNAYNVVPDATGANVTDFKWSNEQIKSIAAAKGDSDTYINAVTMKGQYKSGDNVIEGAINIKANPLPNTTETKIYVTVTDKWGYNTKQEVSVTIKKN